MNAIFPILACIAIMLAAGCSSTGIPECDYSPGKISGEPIKDCPGVVYYDSKEGKCLVQAAGRGESCPESAFKVDKSALLEACQQAAQGQGDIDYCSFRVAEKVVSDALKLCQEQCEGLK